MTRYHHFDSAHARLIPDSIDFVIESVRDANEVLFGADDLPATDLVLAARGVCDTELLLTSQPELLADRGATQRSDWTLACMAEAHTAAVRQLRARGAHDAALRARTAELELLKQLANSSFRSPLLSYTSVFGELIDGCRSGDPRSLLTLRHQYIAEDLLMQRGINALRALHELGEARLKLGEAERAFDLFAQLVRFDPTEVWTHVRLTHTLEREFPELALAAAERAILLLPREDKHGLRPQLRRAMQETRERSASALPAHARALLAQLREKPAKRSRLSLRTLCLELAPEIERVPSKEREPLPDPAALARLRRELQTLPRPLPEPARSVQLETATKPRRESAPAPRLPGANTPGKIGRNELCPCGSGRKHKRCCGAQHVR